jgi:quercetin dioxygenase-like cupin family protein
MRRDDELDVERLARDALHFRRRVVELAPDDELHIDAAAWRDAIIFLDSGDVEVECVVGERRRFSKGAVLCLVPPVRLLRNCGGDRARMIVISRRTSTRATHSG